MFALRKLMGDKLSFGRRTRKTRSSSSRQYRPLVEALEPRNLLTVSAITSGNTLQISISGTDTANLDINGTTIEVRDSTNAIVDTAAESGINAITITGTVGQTETASFNSAFTYANLNSVTVSQVSTIAFNGNNITTSGTNNQQSYTSSNTIAIGASVLTATNGSIFFDSTAGGITEGAGGVVATNLEASATSSIVLEGANTVANVAGTTGASFTLSNSAALTVSTVNSVAGITSTANGDINLKSAGLAVNQAVSAGTGHVRLVETGAVSEAAAASITASGLSISDTTGNVVLEGANNVAGLSVNETATGGGVSFNNSGNALTINTTAAASAGDDPSGLFVAVTGVTTDDGDVNLDTGSLAINEALNAGTGDVRLVASGAISQNATGIITAAGLSVSDSANVVLEQANSIGHLAANLTATAALSLNDTVSLALGTIAAASASLDPSSLFAAVTNTTTAGGDVNLKGVGLTINQAISAGAGNVRLVESGAVTQNANGFITAGGLSVRASVGDLSLGADNHVTTVALTNTSASGAILFNNNTNALTIGTVAAATAAVDPSGLFTSLSGATTVGGNIDLKSSVLTINQAINAGSGGDTVRLVASGNITQSATGTITANALSITNSGGNTILEAANNVATFAAHVTMAGAAVSLNTVSALTVGTVVAENVGIDAGGLFGQVNGAVTNNGDINLKSAGVTITQAINAGTGTVRLVDAGAVTQSAVGTITAGKLSINVTTANNIALNLANNVPVVSVSDATGASVNVNDIATPVNVSSTVAAAAAATDTSGLFGAVNGVLGPTFSTIGNTLVVSGTSGDDQFTLEGGSVMFTAVLNGDSQNFAVATYPNVVFNGNGGNDLAVVASLQGVANATLNALSATVVGTNYNYQVNATAKIYIYGAAGDTATMNDTAGNDMFTGLPAYSVMQNMSGNATVYTNEAIGFSTVNGVSSGGSDIAALYDSAGVDTYTSDSTGSQMSGTGYLVHAAGFGVSYGLFVNGGVDVANLGPNSTTTNYVYGTASDTANISDSEGNDTFYGVPAYGYSLMFASGQVNEPIGFGTVHATSSAGGTDTAILYDNTGNDVFDSTGATSTMTGGGVVNAATGFAINYAFMEFGGTNTANLHAGTSRTNYVYGGANDTANFFDSSGNDIFYGLPSYSLMNYNGSYISQAINFGHINTTSSAGGTDQAYLYDSPGNDSIVVGGSTATLTLASPSVVIQVNDYADVFATSMNGGSDTDHVAAHDFFFQKLGPWTDV